MTKLMYSRIASIIDNLALTVEDQREIRKQIASQFARSLSIDPKFNKLEFVRAATNNPAR